MNEMLGAAGKWEAELGRVYLPGCRECGGSHPHARRNFSGDDNFCPDCGAPVAEAKDLGAGKAKLGIHPMLFLSAIFMGCGRFFNWLARGLDNGKS